MSAAKHTLGPLTALLAAARPMVAMTFEEAREAAHHGKRLMYCQCDVLNACWDNRPDDVPGKHWGGGDACPECNLRAAIAEAEKKQDAEQALLEACGAIDTFFVFFDSHIPPNKGEGAREALRMVRAAITKATGTPVADAETKAAYVAAFGSDDGWLGIEGSYFIEGYREGKKRKATGGAA